MVTTQKSNYMQCQLFSVIPGGIFVEVISKCVVSCDETARVKNNMVAAGDTSVGDPSKKTATHTTTVPLYCGSAGMVRVSTIVPLSFTEPDLISGNCSSGKPFTLQMMEAPDIMWRHLKGGVSVPSSTITLAGTSANPVKYKHLVIIISDKSSYLVRKKIIASTLAGLPILSALIFIILVKNWNGPAMVMQ